MYTTLQVGNSNTGIPIRYNSEQNARKTYSTNELGVLKSIIKDLKNMDNEITAHYPKWANHNEYTKW